MNKKKSKPSIVVVPKAKVIKPKVQIKEQKVVEQAPVRQVIVDAAYQEA